MRTVQSKWFNQRPLVTEKQRGEKKWHLPYWRNVEAWADVDTEVWRWCWWFQLWRKLITSKYALDMIFDTRRIHERHFKGLFWFNHLTFVTALPFHSNTFSRLPQMLKTFYIQWNIHTLSLRISGKEFKKAEREIYFVALNFTTSFSLFPNFNDTEHHTFYGHKISLRLTLSFLEVHLFFVVNTRQVLKLTF